jgi:protein-L-isoaspartate O-methyltransferase
MQKASEWEIYWQGFNGKLRILREQEAEYVRKLALALPLDSQAQVLDFGGGDGFVAKSLSAKVKTVYLWDRSTPALDRARKNLSQHENLRFLDLSNPESIRNRPPFDFILVNSVAQYMSLEEFSDWLCRWERMLARGGHIVVSDVIPPDHNIRSDVGDLLRFSRRRKILLKSMAEFSTVIWRYCPTGRDCPLLRLGENDLRELGRAAKLNVSFLPNLTHFTKRITAVFTH